MALHRSAMGKAVDMSSMVAQNEKVRAVGNMNVNARGDVIDSHGRVIQDNTKRVKTNYNNSVDKSQNDNAHLTPGIHEVHQVKMAKTEPMESEDTVQLSETEQELFDELDNEEEVKK